MARTPAEKRAALEKVNQGLGLARVGDVPHPEKSGGASIKHGLASIGGKIDDALTVPHAALATTLAKAFGKDISWKNAGGDFRTKDGKHGQDIAAEALGIHNKWGKIAFQVIADPLWALGAVKLPKTVVEAGKAAEAITEGSRGAGLAHSAPAEVAYRQSKDIRTGLASALTKTTRAPRVKPERVRVRVGNTRQPATKIGEYVVTTHKGKWYMAPLTRGKRGDEIHFAPSRAEQFDRQDKALTAARRAHYTDTVAQGGAFPASALTRASATVPKGKDVARVRKAFARVYGAPTKSRGLTIGTMRKNAKWESPFAEYGKGRAALPETGPGSGGKLVDGIPADATVEAAKEVRKPRDLGDLASPEAQAHLVDEHGMVTNAADGLLTRIARATDAAKAEHTIGLKVGLGKHTGKFAYAFDTGIRVGNKTGTLTRAAGPLSAVLDPFKKTALGNIARRAEDTAKGFAEDAGHKWQEWAKAKGYDDADAVVMYTVAAFRSAISRADTPEIAAKLDAEAQSLTGMLRSKGLWDDKREEFLRYTRDRQVEQFGGEGRTAKAGTEYISQGATTNSLKAVQELKPERILKPQTEGLDTATIRNYGRKDGRPTPFAYGTADSYAKQLAEAGIPEDVARQIASHVDESTRGLEIDGKAAGFKSEFEDEITAMLKPELNMFTQLGRRDEAHFNRILTGQLHDLVIREGIAKDIGEAGLKFANTSDLKLYNSITQKVNPAALEGTFSSTEIGNWVLRQFTPKFKRILTTANVAHYVRNALGDFNNALVNGSFRHLATNPFRPQGWKLAKGDAEALNADYTIGGQAMKGKDVYALAQWMGLGRGFVKADIVDTVGLFHTGYLARMQQLNVDRENAQRMSTFIKHMKSGDDALTASLKTLRVHFDYNDLTNFEKVTLRNVLLFYTWLKRNTALQISALATRPGYTSAALAITGNRTPFDNETPSYSQNGAFPNPFADKGGIVWGNPVTDGLTKLDLSWENPKKNLLGGINPLAKYLLEAMQGREIYTGKAITDRPHHLLKSFEGPFFGNIERNTIDDKFEGNKVTGLLSGIAGTTVQQDSPKKFKKYQEFIKKQQ